MMDLFDKDTKDAVDNISHKKYPSGRKTSTKGFG